MRTITGDELQAILRAHALWLRRDPAGRSASLSGADLRSASLYGADLRGASLYGADLRSASLSGADLRSASLSDADLRGASLYGADLRGASLYGADLRGASLSGADLRGASLSGANLSDADLSGARWDDDTRLIGDRPIVQIGPIGSRDDWLVVARTDRGLMLHAGCFRGDESQFVARLHDTHAAGSRHRLDYEAALQFARTALTHQ